jgi:hypothetical protein
MREGHSMRINRARERAAEWFSHSQDSKRNKELHVNLSDAPAAS